MAWANQDGSWNDYDMDSNGKKLRVVGTAEVTDWVVKVESGATNRQALLVIGKVQIQEGSTVRGIIKPDASLNQLDINAESDSDPDVRIGCGASIDAGNKVYLMGKHIFIGGTADEQFYRVGIGGPVNVSERLRVPILQADTETQTPSVDPFAVDDVLNLGTFRASQVIIGKEDHLTAVMGRLLVHGSVEMADGLLVSGGNIATNGTVNAANVDALVDESVLELGTSSAGEVIIGRGLHYTIINGLLLVSGSVEMAQGLLVSGGNISTNGTISSQSDLSAQGNATVQGNITAQGTVTAAGFITSGGLTAGGQSVFNGGVDFNEKVAVSAEMEHGAPVKMKGNAIIMGGEVGNELKLIAGEKRFEFWVGDKMSFYVDGTGGHNA
jgi:cytoskeletal protein CcmA (bactofilin family)